MAPTSSPTADGKKEEAITSSGRGLRRAGSDLTAPLRVLCRYEGAWYKDREEGKGTCHLPDGTKYCGAWHEGEMHGKGTLYSKEGGVLYSGRWKNGEPVNVSQ